MIPAMVRVPTIRKMITVMTFMSAIQYSVSPKDCTASTLMRKITARTARENIQTGTDGNQYRRTMALVVVSTATVIAQLNQ